MLVMTATGLSRSGRGTLTRWLQEVQPGVFVGTVSALVRDELWQFLRDRYPDASLTQIWPARSEQGYLIRTHGDAAPTTIDLEGVRLVAVQDAAWVEACRRFGMPVQPD